ncbi:uncharacterized protein LOC115689320 isoform X2 [Syzygium oleosum]|uniref:uncharacterized protein LOC115689320 isoform X2 n=1 Tax=Syzygium oleosum TaxID=219896 RepID=UPI0024B9B0D3|nr:uncharacterized protein LOC115689320 isoform X2 [Syzygium oleosum]
MAEQVTIMVIKVDLRCGRCYKKIQKILCEIPLKDRIFNEKQNTATITVVCCSPEKVRQKICSKGKDFILGIDIIPPKQERPDPGAENKPTETKQPGKKDQSTQTTKTKELGPTPVAPPAERVPPPPVLGYPPVYVMGGLYVCPPCHNRGCGWFCPCNCHYERPPLCHDGCGRPALECRCRRPPMCPDGCRRPAHECRFGRPAPMCHDGCGRPAHECRCGWPQMCLDGCGRPAHECGCWRPSYPRCCDLCNDGSASSSWMLHSCDH